MLLANQDFRSCFIDFIVDPNNGLSQTAIEHGLNKFYRFADSWYKNPPSEREIESIGLTFSKSSSFVKINFLNWANEKNNPDVVRKINMYLKH